MLLVRPFSSDRRLCHIYRPGARPGPRAPATPGILSSMHLLRIVVPSLMLSCLLPAPAEAKEVPDLVTLSQLFPGSKIHKPTHEISPRVAPIGNKDVESGDGSEQLLYPVHRGGLVGVIPGGTVQGLTVGELRLISFRLVLTDTDDVESVIYATYDPKAEPRTWQAVLGLIVVDKDGKFVAKPKGFPLEQEVQTGCDTCTPGRYGRLAAVDAAKGAFILHVDNRMLYGQPTFFAGWVDFDRKKIWMSKERSVVEDLDPSGECTITKKTSDHFYIREDEIWSEVTTHCEGSAPACAQRCKKQGISTKAEDLINEPLIGLP